MGVRMRHATLGDMGLRLHNHILAFSPDNEGESRRRMGERPRYSDPTTTAQWPDRGLGRIHAQPDEPGYCIPERTFLNNFLFGARITTGPRQLGLPRAISPQIQCLWSSSFYCIG